MNFKRSLCVAGVVAVAGLCLCVAARPQSDKNVSRAEPDTYVQLLDDFFEKAHGKSETAVILRVWGGLLPEYEVVLDPATGPKSVTVYSAKKEIWGNAYSVTGPRLSTDQYIAALRKIGLSEKIVPLAEEQVSDLYRQAISVDISRSQPEGQAFVDSKGQTYVVFDAPFLEMITHGGRERVKVTDTSKSDLLSSNPPLLHWAVALRDAARRQAGPASEH